MSQWVAVLSIASRPSKLRSLVFGSILTVISIVAALGAIEIIFRLTRPPHGEMQMGLTDTLHHHKLKPGQIIPNGFDTIARINNLGYRGEDFMLEKKPGTQRVLFLGDSFTWGSGVSDSEPFSAVLGAYFEKHNFPIQIVNGGFASYSPILHYLRTRDEHLILKPDHVFLFYDLTDLQDDFNYERHLVRDKSGKIIGCNPMYIDGKLNFWKLLTAKSAFARYLHNKVVRSYQKMEMVGFRKYIQLKLEGKRTKPTLVNLEHLEKAKGDLLSYDRYIMIRDRSRLPLFEKHWTRSAKYILLLKNLLAQHDIGFTLVLYPHGPQVSARQWRDGKVMWGFDRDKVYDDPYAWGHIKEWARRESVELIDTVPYFKQHGEEDLFFEADVHMNPRGHNIFSEALLADETFRKRLSLDQV